MDSRSAKTSGLRTEETPPSAVRPRFRERQVLRAADLEAEQSYLIAAHRRHNIGQHGWGIVYGLEIQDSPELMVQPGVAVDGYGRELIVTSPVKIPETVFDELEDVALDVWLVYLLEEGNVPQRGTSSCGPGRNTRTREQTRLRLTRAAQTEQRLPPKVPRRPFEVPSADLPFSPDRTPPDDPATEWPVYLGTIKLKEGPKYDPNSPRPFATLNGELVTAPSGLARMQVGAEFQSDVNLFSLSVADASGKSVERIAIDREGKTTITGNTTVTGSGSESARKQPHLLVGRRLNFRALAATPAAAAARQIYRTSIKEDQQNIQQLRFEIGHPGEKGDPTTSRLVIGKRDVNGIFARCFKVSADCTVTINGNVTVTGQLVESPIKPDALDPRYGALLAQVWMQGATVGEVTATTGTVNGTVTEEGGPPLKDVQVELSNEATLITTPAQTDAKGRFTAPQIAVGAYDISAEPPGYKRKTVKAIVRKTDTVSVTLELKPIPPPGTIRGTVRDGAGSVVANVIVHLINAAEGFDRQFLTNEAGQYDAPQIPAGEYSIRLVIAGFPPVLRTLDGGQTLTVDLTVPDPQPD